VTGAPEDVPIRDESIRLGQFLKLANLVESGSEAKPLLAAGMVRVNDEVETRRGRQLQSGDVVSIAAQSARVATGEVKDDLPAAELTRTVAEVFLGIFFVFASAAYWIWERDRAQRLLCSLLPRRHAQTARDTWELIDLKLGAYVRGQALLIVLVGVVLVIVTVQNETVGLAAALLYAVAFTVELGVGVATYFGGEAKA